MAFIRDKQIQDLSAVKIHESSDRRFVSDAKIAEWDAKATKDIASAIANGLMSKEHFAKLEGIEVNANNYVHPVSHPASMIDQDSTHRMVSDVKIAEWDAKATTDLAAADKNGLMSKEDFSKLSGIEANANNYSHPTTHSIDMITTTAEKQTVSQTEKDTWNAKQNALGFTPENVANKNVANGYAGLDGNGKISIALLPDASLQQTHIVATLAARDALIPTLKTADRVIVMNAGDGSREGFIFDQTLNEGAGGFHKDSDTDWENINLDWANIVNGPLSTPAEIDTVVDLTAQIQADSAKLAGIQSGAEVNQNAFSTFGNGTANVNATSKTDSATFVGGTNISVDLDQDLKKFTFNVTGKVASAANADLADASVKLQTARKIQLTGDVIGEVTFDGTGDVQIATTVVELNTHHHDISEVDGLQAALNLKAGLDTATPSANGLMSSGDKTKLDGLVKRYVKRILKDSLTVPGGGNFQSGIRTDSQGLYYTDIPEVGLFINGILQTPGVGKDFTVSVDAQNEIIINWGVRSFSIEPTDEIIIEYNQLG